MKKTAHIKSKYLWLFLFLPFILFAQLSFGVIGGANIGKFGGVEPRDASYTSLSGLNLGAVMGYRFNKDVSLIFQPTFSQRGSNIEVGEDTFFDSLQVYTARIDFLALPLFIRVDSDNGVTYFISGLEIAIPLSLRMSHDEEKIDLSDWLKKADILASIGMGLHFSLGRPQLIIEFRYYQGLVNFNSQDGKDGEQLLFQNFKNSGFQFMAGVEWELRR